MGVTILLITHQMQVVQMICNKVAVMENGKVVESGSVLDVFGKPQAPVTKRFVQTVINDQIPESIVSLVKEQKEHFQVERLKFIGSSVKRPVISDICQVEGIVVNILGATVQELQENVMCVFILQLIGSEDKICEAEKQIDAKWRNPGKSGGNLMEQQFFGVSLEKLLTSGGQTLYMVALALIIGTVIGIVLALILVLCKKAVLQRI